MAKKKSKKFEFSKIGSLIDNIAKKTPILIEKTDKKIHHISTGVYILNACLSGSLFGGVKGDAITVFAGPESSGKTFLSLNICREAQKDGYGVVYIDTENSISRGDLPNYGVDNSLDKFILIKSNKVEDINFTLSQLLDDLKEQKMAGNEVSKLIIVIDSLGQLASNKEKEDLLDGKLVADMTKAKSIGSLFRSITVDLGYLDIPMVVNNQTYQTMSFFPQEVMKGGKALYYSASNITFLGKAKLKTGEEDEYDLQGGIVVTAKGVKNRQSKPKKVKFEINFQTGCNPYVGLDMFCVPRFFDQIGIAKGKFEKYAKPKEFVDENTGEVIIREGELKPGGNRWYVRHLGKSVWTKHLFTEEVFTQEVLDAIEPIAQQYFNYRSIDEIEEVEKEFIEKAKGGKSTKKKKNDDDDFSDIDLDDLTSEDLFD